MTLAFVRDTLGGVADDQPSNGGKRNGKLSIPLPFNEAVKAALEVKPPEKKPRKPQANGPAGAKRSSR
jgi:hypothetical protein